VLRISCYGKKVIRKFNFFVRPASVNGGLACADTGTRAPISASGIILNPLPRKKFKESFLSWLEYPILLMANRIGMNRNLRTTCNVFTNNQFKYIVSIVDPWTIIFFNLRNGNISEYLSRCFINIKQVLNKSLKHL
jgi:hypothetical protein